MTREEIKKSYMDFCGSSMGGHVHLRSWFRQKQIELVREVIPDQERVFGEIRGRLGCGSGRELEAVKKLIEECRELDKRLEAYE